MRALIAALALPFFAACAGVPMAPTSEDTTAKTFTAVPGNARVYLFRDETFGAAIAIPVMLNGKLMGRTAAKTYFMWDVPPGDVEVSSIAEDTSTVRIKAEGGRLYFIWQEIKMGLWQPRTILHRVDDDRGREGVQASGLIGSSTP